MNMNLVKTYAMFSSCGVEDPGDGLLYIKGTSKKAHGTYVGYFPKFIGFGTSNKIAHKLEVDNGELLSITGYDRNGNIIKETKAWIYLERIED